MVFELSTGANSCLENLVEKSGPRHLFHDSIVSVQTIEPVYCGNLAISSKKYDRYFKEKGKFCLAIRKKKLKT